MRKLNHYIARSVTASVAIVLLVIVGLDAISALVDQLGDMRHNYNFIEVLIYVGLTLPSRINELIPMSALIGSLIGLGMLASSSELTIMRAAGISVSRITWSVVKPALLFIFLGLALGEYVIPLTDQIAESRRSLAQGDDRALQSRSGLWNREGNEFMHFNAVLPNGKLYGVTRYEFDENNRLLKSSFSRNAIYQGNYWLEQDVSETRLYPDHTVVDSFATREWHTNLSPKVLNVLVLEPEELSIQSLYSYADYVTSQGFDSQDYRLALWQKLLQPLATLSLVLIAVSFIFGPLREVTMGHRIFSGVIVGIVFRTSQDLLGPSSLVFGFPPLLAVLAPIILCFLAGIILLRRTN